MAAANCPRDYAPHLFSHDYSIGVIQFASHKDCANVGKANLFGNLLIFKGLKGI